MTPGNGPVAASPVAYNSAITDLAKVDERGTALEADGAPMAGAGIPSGTPEAGTPLAVGATESGTPIGDPYS